MSRKSNPLAYEVKEADLQRTIVTMAESLGWVTWHDNDSRKNDPGLPDLILVHPDHGLLFLELKTMTGRVKPIQRWWIDLLTQAGQQAFIVRPSEMNFVEALLRGERMEQVAA